MIQLWIRANFVVRLITAVRRSKKLTTACSLSLLFLLPVCICQQDTQERQAKDYNHSQTNHSVLNDIHQYQRNDWY